jgi:hypothetical protein
VPLGRDSAGDKDAGNDGRAEKGTDAWQWIWNTCESPDESVNKESVH